MTWFGWPARQRYGSESQLTRGGGNTGREKLILMGCWTRNRDRIWDRWAGPHSLPAHLTLRVYDMKCHNVRGTPSALAALAVQLLLKLLTLSDS